MSLIISLPGEEPYIIRGKKEDDGTFAGRHEGVDDGNEVSASWTMLDQAYVGRWHEEDEFFLFSFTIVNGDRRAKGG
jgi:hypothetical protein